MHSHRPLQLDIHSRRMVLLFCTCVFLLWFLLAPTGTPIRAELHIPGTLSAEQPLCLEVTVNAPLPLKLPLELPASLQHHLIRVVESHDAFSGFCLRGPLWKQRLQLIPCSLQPMPGETITIGGLSVGLPALTPKLPDCLPCTPVILPPAQHTPFAGKVLPPLLALALLTAIILKRPCRKPQALLRKLQPTANGLEQVPHILIQAHIRREDHPDFFQQLDLARFSSTPPSTAQISSLLRQAHHILQEHP